MPASHLAATGKSSVSVRDDGRRQLEDVVKELVSNVDSGGGGGAGDKVSLLGELVNKDSDGVEFATGGRERTDEIHGNDFPALRGDGKGLQESRRSVL